MELFKNKNEEYIDDLDQNEEDLPHIPDGLWFKCIHCEKTIYTMEVKETKTCPSCDGNFRMSAFERINLIADENTFVEMNREVQGQNYLDYPNYEDKITKLQSELDINEAVTTGVMKISGVKTCVGVMDSRFIMGSMGYAVGERITRLFEHATKEKLPVIIFTASGGARMQEGIISLMQMAKVSMAVKKHSDSGQLYISYLTDPTTGGVTASFAMLGDIIIAEPKALIGFAGKRVIEQTINEKLPDDFQSAEMLLQTGFVDKIVKREDMKDTLSSILRIHYKAEGSGL